MVGARLSPASRVSVEKWAQAELDKPTLSEAIRRLIEIGLVKSSRRPCESRQGNNSQLHIKEQSSSVRSFFVSFVPGADITHHADIFVTRL
jgi:hypothetical protein